MGLVSTCVVVSLLFGGFAAPASAAACLLVGFILYG